MNIDDVKYGVYLYRHDKKVIYVGKDSNIWEDERYRQHLKPSRYNRLRINRYVQDNNDWTYEVVATFAHKSDMEQYEKILIERYQPVLNIIWK